jgi:hypothetical protein
MVQSGEGDGRVRWNLAGEEWQSTGEEDAASDGGVGGTMKEMRVCRGYEGGMCGNLLVSFFCRDKRGIQLIRAAKSS